MLSVVFEGVEYRFYDHIYAVSECGKFLRNLKPYQPNRNKSGYFGVGRQRLAHRMVASCWLTKPNGAKVVHHKNGNKSDNRAENLEWVENSSAHISEYHSDSATGHRCPDWLKEKLRKLRTGSKQSEETINKRVATFKKIGHRPPPRKVGEKSPQSAIDKMMDHNPMARACEVNGVRYRSFSEAGRALGEHSLSLRKRCLSHNFPNYKLAEL